jgi:hypothetical protein
VRAKTLTVSLLLTLLATGCFRSDTRIRVDEDGSGEVEQVIALDIDAALDIGGAFAGDDVPELTRDDVCSDFESQQDVPEGATVRPVEEDGFCGISYTLAFGPDEFGDAMSQAAAGGQFELRREGEGWYFETELTNEDLTGEDPSGGDELGAELVTETFFDDASMTVGVLLPGRLVDHNATYIDTDGTAVWEIDLAAESTNMYARTEPGETILGDGPGGSDGGSAVTIVIVLIVLALAALGVWWWIKRGRRDDSTGPGSSLDPPGAPHPVSPEAPPGPPPGSPSSPPPQGSPPLAPPPGAPGGSLPPPTSEGDAP